MPDGARLKAARKDAQLSQSEVARRLGVPQSVVSDWENDKLASWTDRSDELERLYGKAQGYLKSSMPVKARGIEAIGQVQGGAFQLAVEWPEEERFEVPMAPLPGFEGIDLMALRVVGPSVNQIYPDGTFVIVASAADLDVRPGDKVVVYQHRSGLTEATIKEVRQEPNGRVVLWPRSDHPDFKEPIYLDPEDQDSPEIAFVVVGSFRLEQRPPAPIQHRPRRR